MTNPEDDVMYIVRSTNDGLTWETVKILRRSAIANYLRHAADEYDDGYGNLYRFNAP